MHRTLGYPHERNVHWDDVNVVLLGILDQGELREYLQGPPLHIELHDRDRDPDIKTIKADLFGNCPEDEFINNVGLVAGMCNGASVAGQPLSSKRLRPVL